MSHDEADTRTIEAKVAELEITQVATLRERLIDGLADTLRPRTFDHGQMRLDKFNGTSDMVDLTQHQNSLDPSATLHPSSHGSILGAMERPPSILW